VTGVQTCALPISAATARPTSVPGAAAAAAATAAAATSASMTAVAATAASTTATAATAAKPSGSEDSEEDISEDDAFSGVYDATLSWYGQDVFDTGINTDGGFPSTTCGCDVKRTRLSCCGRLGFVQVLSKGKLIRDVWDGHAPNVAAIQSVLTF